MMISQALQRVKIHSVLPGSGLTLEADPGNPQRLSLLKAKGGLALGWLVMPDACDFQVVFYEGKGGLTAVISVVSGSQSGLQFFVLPGSSLRIPVAGGSAFELNLTGERIRENTLKSRQTLQRQKPQTVTTQAMILGAGLATRFEPVSGDSTQYSKPAVPLVGERSVIECIVQAIARDNFNRLFINTFYKKESLKSRLDQVPGVTVCYLDEAAPSGTAGALRKMLDPQCVEAKQIQAQFDPSLPLLVVQGDAVTDAHFSDLLAAHLENKAAITIGCQVVRDEEVHQFGIVETDQSGKDGVSGRIIGFKEKPLLKDAGPHRMASTGFYLFAPEAYGVVLEAYRKRVAEASGGEVALDFANDVFPEAFRQVAAGQIKSKADGTPMVMYAQVVDGYWSDIGNPTQYFETVHDVYAGKVDIPLPKVPGQFFENGVVYWPKAKEAATQLHTELNGNILVAFPFEKAPA